MSEYRQATAHVEALEAHLSSIRTGLTDDMINSDLSKNLGFLLAAIDGEIDATMNKLRARCTMVDPVTKNPRFGPTMLAKVQNLLHRYDIVKLAVEANAPLRIHIEAKLSQLIEQEKALKEEAVALKRKALEAQQALKRAKEQEKERLAQEARKQEAESIHQEQQRMRELAAAAQEIRKQRVKEQAEEERRRQWEKEERIRMSTSVPRGSGGLVMAIGMLRKSTGSEAQFRQSMQNLVVVVNNICNSPENLTFRQIPKDNDSFHKDLGQYTGGYHCLIALGFQELEQLDTSQPRTVFWMEESNLHF
ncbi:hypothetical protein CCR75_003120 [Bremia lactucae]|uniref:PUB domain-containing protein n=1 Tax=Bremia lactucae TaxID=4779 RepID=A0A976IC91_BRELC|nr:hypothetical protein CCR75_003120 [Bremia lactucae]